MATKYCPQTGCGFANIYTLEAPAKCEKCKKDFLSAFTTEAIASKTYTRRDVKKVDKRATAPKKYSNPDELDEDEIDTRTNDEIINDADFYREECASLIDGIQITVNAADDGSVVSFGTDDKGQVSLGRKSFTPKNIEQFKRK